MPRGIAVVLCLVASALAIACSEPEVEEETAATESQLSFGCPLNWRAYCFGLGGTCEWQGAGEDDPEGEWGCHFPYQDPGSSSK